MGKNCRLNGALACSKPGSTNNNNNTNGGFPVQPAGDPRPQCSTLASAQSANPNASFSCVASSGKQETLSCTVNGVTNTFTGKKKKIVSWATSSSCTSFVGGASFGSSTGTSSGGSPTCNCQAEVANFLNIRVNMIQIFIINCIKESGIIIESLVHWQQCVQMYEQKWRNNNFSGKEMFEAEQKIKMCKK